MGGRLFPFTKATILAHSLLLLQQQRQQEQQKEGASVIPSPSGKEEKSIFCRLPRYLEERTRRRMLFDELNGANVDI